MSSSQASKRKRKRKKEKTDSLRVTVVCSFVIPVKKKDLPDPAWLLEKGPPAHTRICLQAIRVFKIVWALEWLNTVPVMEGWADSGLSLRKN